MLYELCSGDLWLINCSGHCASGYFCRTGVPSANASSDHDGVPEKRLPVTLFLVLPTFSL